ncbi:hypothetical protein ES703_109617 [subsurface metagenome]
MGPALVPRIVIGVKEAGGRTLVRILLGINAGYAYSEGTVDRPHPIRVTPGQVVINRNQVTAPTGEGVQIEGKGSHQGFTLTSFHLSNSALIENDTPHQLHIKVALPYSPLGRFTNGGKGFREKFIESLIKRAAILKPSLKLIGLGAKLIIA